VTDQELVYHSYQLFVQHFLNPNTPHKRLYLNHGTGTGKTLSAIGIALRFIDLYKQAELADENAPSVGSVKSPVETAFHREFMRFPELKFITRDERRALTNLKIQAFRTGSTALRERVKDMEMRIKRRFSNRRNYGYFTFLGYKAFFNRLFTSTADIELYSLTEDQLKQHISDGTVRINKTSDSSNS
jgi:hypothetical protein